MKENEDKKVLSYKKKSIWTVCMYNCENIWHFARNWKNIFGFFIKLCSSCSYFSPHCRKCSEIYLFIIFNLIFKWTTGCNSQTLWVSHELYLLHLWRKHQRNITGIRVFWISAVMTLFEFSELLFPLLGMVQIQSCR